MEDLARNEILELHGFLEAWLKGAVPQSTAEFARLGSALADDFFVIYPTGAIGTRRDVLHQFASAYGTKGAAYRLQINDLALRIVADNLALATYFENHHTEPGRARISSALLGRERGNGAFKWLFLQETLISDQG